MKISAIIAAVENGAVWQRKPSGGTWYTPEGDQTILNLCSHVGHNYEVRLKPQKKTVPLGPDDWDGVWWVKQLDYTHIFMVVSLEKEGIYFGQNYSRSWRELLVKGFHRSQDHKTWTPCSKEVEE